MQQIHIYINLWRIIYASLRLFNIIKYILSFLSYQEMKALVNFYEETKKKKNMVRDGAACAATLACRSFQIIHLILEH